MSDEIGFEDKGNIEIPEKGDIRREKMISDVKKSLTREQIKDEVKDETGMSEKKGALTKDVPQLVFKMGAKLIGCPKFELDDSEANTMATHLNILLPLDGKLASVVVVVMITLNKVFVCMDAISAKFKRSSIEKEEEKPNLPEQLS